VAKVNFQSKDVDKAVSALAPFFKSNQQYKATY